VKSENTALHTAATIFVKFASQTGIIVSEALMRDHFSVYGEILDATIRTITIDEVSDCKIVPENSIFPNFSFSFPTTVHRRTTAPRAMAL